MEKLNDGEIITAAEQTHCGQHNDSIGGMEYTEPTGNFSILNSGFCLHPRAYDNLNESTASVYSIGSD